MTVVNTAKIGGTDITVGRIGHGLMMMTLRDPAHPLSDEEAFEAIKAGVDAMPAGVKALLNSGEFYGLTTATANLELLSRFYAKYPDYAEKTFLSVKGGMKPNSLISDGSPENLRRSVENINAKLGGIKKMDLFESARVPENASLEDLIKTLSELKSEGHFSYIGMSECSAETLKRAHALHPIAIVEIEVSLWSYEEETKKVIATAQELGISIAAYSPLGRGFLTGTIQSPKDLSAGDVRHRLTRFQEEEVSHNIAFVNAIKGIAEKKGVTPAQLAISWVLTRGAHVIPIPGSSNKKRTLENIGAADVVITEGELAAIDNILATHSVKGGRYNDKMDPKMLRLWG